MPKVLDHEQRQRHIVEAVWRIVAVGGLHEATVRRVADEAGISVGSLRNSFPTQTSLYECAMRSLMESVERQIDEKASGVRGSSEDVAIDLLLSFVPLDDEQAKTLSVWLAFSVEAQRDAALRPLNDEVFDKTRTYLTSLLAQLAEDGIVSRSLDVADEAARLHALLDGLTLHRLTRPDVVGPEQVVDVLRAHLACLHVD